MHAHACSESYTKLFTDLYSLYVLICNVISLHRSVQFMFLQIEMFHKSNYCLGLGPLLLLLLAVVGGASDLMCKTDVNCPVGVDFCPVLCQPEDHSCIANFRINSLGQRNDLFYD